MMLAGVAGLLAITTPAMADPGGDGKPEAGSVCIDVSRIAGWSVVDDRTVAVRTGASGEFLVKLSGLARAVNLRSAGQIGFVPNSTGQLCALGGHVVAGGIRVPVSSITADMGKADAPRG